MIAAALHAGLLLVIPRGPVPAAITKVLELVPRDDPRRDLIEEKEIPPPEESYDEKVTPTSPITEPPPTGPDESKTSLDPWDIVTPRQPLIPTGPDRPSIPIGPFGPPGEPGDKPGPRRTMIDLRHLDNTPRARAQHSPQYPYEARSRGLTGQVVVEFIVDENGHVLDPRVVRSTDPVFEEASLRAVAKWRFEPGIKHGRPVRFRMVVPVLFNLND